MHIPTREISVQQIPILAECRAFLASGSDPPTQLMRIEGLIYVHKVVSRGVSTLLGLTVRLHKLLDRPTSQVACGSATTECQLNERRSARTHSRRASVRRVEREVSFVYAVVDAMLRTCL